jgi:hypothetical protein
VTADETLPDGSVEVRKIRVHRILLAAGSSFFEKAFDDDDTTEVHLQRVSFEQVSIWF